MHPICHSKTDLRGLRRLLEEDQLIYIVNHRQDDRKRGNDHRRKRSIKGHSEDLYNIIGVFVDHIELWPLVQLVELDLEVIAGVELKLELLEDVLGIEEIDQDSDDTRNDDQAFYLLLQVLHLEEETCGSDKGNDVVDECRVEELGDDVFGE